MAHPDSREGIRISRFHPQMSSFHLPCGSNFKLDPSCPQPGTLPFPHDGECAEWRWLTPVLHPYDDDRKAGDEHGDGGQSGEITNEVSHWSAPFSVMFL
ncbi:hypothetical protein [Pararhizobium sp. PWRC1-1]|uniref:hypothetical protein n=1 Tax=Pararhizobium sp. PWRC1-1 TaxID=2804566 RepID=UPI003CEE3602